MVSLVSPTQLNIAEGMQQPLLSNHHLDLKVFYISQNGSLAGPREQNIAWIRKQRLGTLINNNLEIELEFNWFWESQIDKSRAKQSVFSKQLAEVAIEVWRSSQTLVLLQKQSKWADSKLQNSFFWEQISFEY